MPSTPTIEAVIEDKPTDVVVAQLELAFEPAVQDQPKPLTKQQFRKKFGFPSDKAGNEAYGKACIKGRAKGWVAEDGSRWFTTADSKDGRWSTDKAAVKQLELV